MIEFDSAVIHRVIGSTLAAKSAALASAVARHMCVRFLTQLQGVNIKVVQTGDLDLKFWKSWCLMPGR